MGTSRWIEHRGCRLSYSVRGSGPRVLMIQGVGVHGDGWRPQVDALSSRFECATFDNRGMGLSQPLGSVPALTIEQMSEDALTVMDSLGWESAHVVGHSMGGLIAQQLALSARPRVRSLSLLCTFARGSDATRLSARMAWIGLRSRIGPRRARRRAFLELIVPPAERVGVDLDAMAEKLEPLFGHDLADATPVMMKQMGAMSRFDATPRLRELAGIPTLVVSAELDPIASPPLGRALASGIPGARYVELPGDSHGVPIQHPERINALLEAHFDGAGARAPTGS